MNDNHLANREYILDHLKREVVGPDPRGELLEELNEGGSAEPYITGPYRIRCKHSGDAEEILRNEPPNVRYGVGVLYPPKVDKQSAELANPVEADDEAVVEVVSNDHATRELLSRDSLGREKPDGSDSISLDLANCYQQSSMGVSFLVEVDTSDVLRVVATFGRYTQKQVRVRSANPDGQVDKVLTERWWVRSKVVARGECRGEQLLSNRPIDLHLVVDNGGDIVLKGRVVSRSLSSIQVGERLLTVVVQNDSSTDGFALDRCLYQSEFAVTIVTDNHLAAKILPYPRVAVTKPSQEERGLSLLYRDFDTFAVGHGCSATWKLDSVNRKATEVSCSCFPIFETPSIAFDVFSEAGERLQMSMNELSAISFTPDNEAAQKLTSLVGSYRAWIADVRERAKSKNLDSEAIARHLQQCELCATRIEAGVTFLRRDADALRAFKLANEAMQLQAVTSRLSRPAIATGERESWTFGDYPSIDGESSPRTWRPFQIAFLLMSLRSVALSEPDESVASERDVVDLIWFPTGGGKTEAYLGLSAFLLLYKRITNENSGGTQVLMRYTLRLLTQQQVERAASLFCALEHIRFREGLGVKRFSVGIWAGADFVPNRCAEATKQLGELQQTGRVSSGNLLVLTKCPWCGAEIGVKQGRPPVVLGLYQYKFGKDQSVRYACPDRSCPFRSPAGMGGAGGLGLPVKFIDQEMYEDPPSLLIGTIDKFATMHLQPKARAFFGIKANTAAVERTNEPPSLIIQDELHLISGPLGSMAGLYEGLIERMCEEAGGRRPKIVCSTATIRSFEEQVRALFGRDQAALFPAPAADASDSFFAKYAKSENGELLPGKKYVGVLATGYTSPTLAAVRSLSALMQAPLSLADHLATESSKAAEGDCFRTPGPKTCSLSKDACMRSAQDPWWTNIIFFNSLRELGNAITLFQSDIPDFRTTVVRRHGFDRAAVRTNVRLRELTGRLRNDEVSQALSDLAVQRTDENQPAVGACLASSIIEVGIDVDRLSLMCVMAQPKTTSQYIQVTGRVGRSWRYDTATGAPGLVVVLYSADRPRDRSHFERFRSYHEQLYAQVEPTSLTPFATPVLERALHGVYVAYTRLIANPANPSPYPDGVIVPFLRYLEDRIARCGFSAHEQAELGRVARSKLLQWRDAPPAHWSPNYQNKEEECLTMMPNGDPTAESNSLTPWPTPSSMRNVDADVPIHFTQWFTESNVETGEEVQDPYAGL